VAWSGTFQPQGPKKSLDVEEVNNTLKPREDKIRKKAIKIANLVRATVDKLTDRLDSPETKQYLDYVASLIREGLANIIIFSFNALLKDLSMKPSESGAVSRSNVIPLITTKLELIGNHVVFSPPLMEGPESLYQQFQEWCQRALDLTQLISVFCKGQVTIHSEILKDETIGNARQSIWEGGVRF
jgi:hypothetical protein